LATLNLSNATKSFGNKPILTEASLTLETGEILGIFGRNGSGKSTLLKMMFGTLQSDSIKMDINSCLFSPSENIKKEKIAYLPQHPFLPKNVRVRDIIPMYFSSEEKQDAVFYDPGISKITVKKAGELSLGELKYFEIILIGNLNHPFLMLDEPFSMLEPFHKESIKQFLIQLKNKKGIIITDHYYEDVLSITTKNIILKDGKSEIIHSKEELIKMEYLSKNSL